MDLTYTSNFRDAIASLKNIRVYYKTVGERWVSEACLHFKEQLIANLASQGQGSQPLSPMTRLIYDRTGEPDGSGIVEHIGITVTRVGNSWVGTIGIKSGKPTMIALVQDQGASILVTEAMRGFLSSAYGIHLRQETTHIHIPGRRFWRLSCQSTRQFALQKLKK